MTKNYPNERDISAKELIILKANMLYDWYVSSKLTSANIWNWLFLLISFIQRNYNRLANNNNFLQLYIININYFSFCLSVSNAHDISSNGSKFLLFKPSLMLSRGLIVSCRVFFYTYTHEIVKTPFACFQLFTFSFAFSKIFLHHAASL